MLSRLPKIGAFTILSLSIAACSSNNHNNNSIKATRLASMAAAFSASELDEFGIGVGFIELLLL